MAEFGVNATQMPTPQGRGAQPLAPVMPAVSQYSLPAGIVDVAVAFVKDRATKENDGSAIIKQYNDQLYKIEQAVSSGQMKPAEAYTRAQAVSAQSLNLAGGNVKAIEGIKKVRDSYFGMGGLEEADVQVQAERDKIKWVMEEGRNMGIGSLENASDDYYRNYADDVMAMKASANQTARALQELNLMDNVDARSVRQQELAVKNIAVDWVRSNVTPITSLATNTGRELKEMVASGKITPQEAAMRLSQTFSDFRQGMAEIATTNPEVMRGAATYVDNLEKQISNWLDPSITAQDLENQIKVLNAESQLFLRQDGDMNAYLAMSDMFRDNPMLVHSLTPLMSSVFGKLTASQGTNADMQNVSSLMNAASPSDKKATFTSTKAAINSVMPHLRQGTSAGAKGVDNLVNNLLGYSATFVNNPERYNAAEAQEYINFLASPEFGMWMQTSGNITPDSVQAASHVFQSLYLEQVQMPLFHSLSESAYGVDPDSFVGSYVAMSAASVGVEAFPVKDLTLLDVTDVVWDGRGVSFVQREIEGLPNNRVSPKAIETMNKSTKMLNTMIRAGANLAGETDIQKYWERNKHNILPLYYSKGVEIGTKVEGREYIGGSVNSKFSYR